MLDVIAWIVLSVLGTVGFVVFVAFIQIGRAFGAWLSDQKTRRLPDSDTRALRKHRTWADAELHRIYAKAEEQYD